MNLLIKFCQTHLNFQIWGAPNISAESEVILQADMVFSIEPGIYLPNEFGVRLEEIIYLREEGPEILSELSRSLNL